jgi:hypothetical protein
VSSHWELKEFRVLFPRWRDLSEPKPPPDVAKRIDIWWRGLEFSPDRPRADRVSPDRDPVGNLWWTWVPNGDWTDEQKRRFRVVCYMRVFEHDDPRRIVCEKFETCEAIPPAAGTVA